MLLLTLSFIVLWAFGDVIALAAGAYRTNSPTCVTEQSGGASCTTTSLHWTWVPAIVVAVIAATYLTIAWWNASKAALAITKARPADGPEYATLRNVVDGIAIAAGIPNPAVYVIDDPAPNAYATGMHPNRAAIVATSGLLAIMSRRELEGVIAHEMSHIRNRDTTYMTLAVLTAGAIVVISDLCLRIGFYSGMGRRRNDNDAGALLIVIGLVGFLLAVPCSLLLKAALSRRREALADETAVELTRYPAGLRAALEKLEGDTTVVRATSHATAHLWIETPLERTNRQGLGGSLAGLFDTHPPLATRIAALRAMEGLDPNERGPVDPPPGTDRPPPPPRTASPLPPPHPFP
jgi:heat shock protein HtpX